MNGDDLDVLSELSDLTETLTTSGSRTLDEKLFKRVKSICKSSDDNVRHLYRLVMTQLEKRHSEIRLSALQIINEIFTRSHAFRELLVDDLQKLFTLTIGVNSKKPLPEPKAVASILRNEAFKAIESWHQKYGAHYMKLALGYKYLKRVKKFNFNNSQAHTELEQQIAEDAETRRTNHAEQKLAAVLAQMGESVSEIQGAITEMGNCFQLVLPSLDNFDIHTDNAEEQRSKMLDSDMPSTSSGITHDLKSTDMKASNSFSKLNDNGLSTKPYQLSITLSKTIEIVETSDNTDVLNTLFELNKQIIEKYLPLTQKWLEVLTKHSGHHENLVQAIDLKNLLIELMYKFDRLKIVFKNANKNATSQRKLTKQFKSKGNENTKDDFIDVPEKEGLEHVPESRRHEYGLEPVDCMSSSTSRRRKDEYTTQTSGTIGWTPHGNPSTIGDPSSRATAIAALLVKHENKNNQKSSQSVSTCTITRPIHDENEDESLEAVASSTINSPINEKRTKLLKRAPVVPYGMDLYNWESKEDETPSVLSLKNLHCFWAHPNEDTDNHCPGDMKESMKSRSIPFAGVFQEIKWACRAPLPSGKLCPRKDKYKCPFHGKIIRRDEMGQPEGEAIYTEDTAELHKRELDEVTKDVELATGMDLGSKKEKRGKKRKHEGLTDLKKNSNTSRVRLEKIVFNKASLTRVAEETDRVKKSLVDEKFGNNWNYALKETY